MSGLNMKGLWQLLNPMTRVMIPKPAAQNSAVVACSHFFSHRPSNSLSVETSNQDEPDKLYKLIELEVKAYEPSVLKSYEWFVTTAARHLGIKVGDCWAIGKPDHNRYTLLKSVHIYKKHRVQYEIRTYFRFMQFKFLTGSTADTFLEYIERNLPEGVGMKVTKVAIEALPEYLKKPIKGSPKDEQTEIPKEADKLT